MPILASGDPIGPILNGITYIMRPEQPQTTNSIWFYNQPQEALQRAWKRPPESEVFWQLDGLCCLSSDRLSLKTSYWQQKQEKYNHI